MRWQEKAELDCNRRDLINLNHAMISEGGGGGEGGREGRRGKGGVYRRREKRR